MRKLTANKLTKNLSALCEDLRESHSSLDKKGRAWFDRYKADHFPPNATEFPSRGTLGNWLNEERCPKEIFPEKLAFLFAYLRHGRFGEAPPQNFLDGCRELAQRACDTLDPKEFVESCQIAPTKSQRPVGVVRETESIPESEVTHMIQTAFGAVQKARNFIQLEISKLDDTEVELSMRWERLVMASGSRTTVIDEEVENQIIDFFGESDSEICVQGEERLKAYKGAFRGWQKRKCALVDGVDGTNLAAMGIPLWCTAVTLYDRDHTKVLASVVGLPTGKICVARHEYKEAWIGKDIETCAVPNGNKSLYGHSGLVNPFQARIAFFGQKPKNYLSVAGDEKFIKFLEHAHKNAEEKHEDLWFRIYNFGGNPLLVKLVDRKGDCYSRIAEGVDIVFERSGQMPHDFVAGAFIALQKGAYMCDLSRVPITTETLGTILEDPKHRRQYVIAATRELAEAFLSFLTV